MIKILPLLFPALFSFWNTSNVPATTSINANPSTLSFASHERKDFLSQAGSSVLILTGDPNIKAWITLGTYNADGTACVMSCVAFEALAPATSWTFPVNAGTGVLISNPNAAQQLHFTFNGITLPDMIGQYETAARFVWELYGHPLIGNLTISADAPIVVWATDCNTTTCVSIPTSPN